MWAYVIPATPVKGRVAGVDVTPEVLLEGTDLVFNTYKAGTPKDEPPAVERSVRLKLAPMLLVGEQPPKVVGRSWKVKVDAAAGSGSAFSKYGGKSSGRTRSFTHPVTR